jgi:hypothetical protein
MISTQKHSYRIEIQQEQGWKTLNLSSKPILLPVLTLQQVAISNRHDQTSGRLNREIAKWCQRMV